MTQPPSALDQLLRKSGHHVHRLKAKDSTGRWAYYFVYVPPHREARFLAALKRETTVDLEDFGKVVASNYGEAPNAQTLAELESRYGWKVDEFAPPQPKRDRTSPERRGDADGTT